MGQQQLLLLVLSIVIVGTAIVVGINAYSENAVRANFDTLLQETLRIASDAQSWKQKPEIFGGSPDGTKSVPADFSGITFPKIGYSGAVDGDGLCFSTLNGTFELEGTTTGLTIKAVNESNTNAVEITVDGTRESNIVISTRIIGGVNETGATTSVADILSATCNPTDGSGGSDGSG